MRYTQALWLLRFTEKYGIGLDPGEDAEVDAARFRVLGLLAVQHPADFQVTSDVALEGIADWERPLLTGVATDLRESLTPANDNAAEGDDDGLW
jgi:hypothetical protein